MKAVHSREHLQKIFSSFRPGPEIFQLIINYSRNSKIKLEIPHTLMYLPSQSFPVYLSTQPNGYIAIDNSKYSIGKFFEAIESIPINEKFPKYIHIAMNERFRLCHDEHEARRVFEECPHFSHRLHNYIEPVSKHASKLRVHWKLFKHPIAYILTNNLPALAHQAKIRHIKSSSGTLPELNHHKSQSSSDFKGTLRTVLNISKLINKKDDSVNPKRLIVDFTGSSESSVIIANRYLPELKDIINTIVKIVNTVFFHSPSKVQEVLIDFVKSPDKKWVVTACKGHKLDGDPKYLELKKPIEEPQSETFLQRKPSIMLCESVTEESLKSDASLETSKEDEKNEIERAVYRIQCVAAERKKIQTKEVGKLNKDTYYELRQCDDKGRVPRLMIGILPHKIENPITFFIEKSKDPPVKPTRHKDRAQNLHWVGNGVIPPAEYVKVSSKHINEVSKMYNKHRYEAHVGRIYLSSKKKISIILKDKEKEIKNAVEDFLMSMKKEWHFSMLFENRSHQEICSIGSRIVYSLNPPSELNMREELRNVHKRYKIIRKDFNDFVENLDYCIRAKAGIMEDQADIILERLRSFEKDILMD